MSNRKFFFLLFSALAVHVLNLRLDVMEVDAAQYAEMSWEMFTTKSYLQIFCLGTPYLDKPPLLFWLNSLSFSDFGISNFSYKFPSFLFAVLGVYSTYRFTKIFYTENIARYATVMLATSQAMFLITNDVRTDTLLMGAVIFSIWQWTEFFQTSKTKNLLLGSAGVALALLAKGPIGLMVVGAAILPHLILKKEGKKISDWRILVGVVVIGIFLLPMCIGLYQQWGMKGLKFYFWTQSFGRITGESEWKNNPDKIFLLHSTAWGMLPWAVFFFAGWVKSGIDLVKKKFPVEIISFSGFTLILIALSLSKFQLPHYIFVVFPLAAVIAAKHFSDVLQNEKQQKTFFVVHVIVVALLLVVTAFLQWSFGEESNRVLVTAAFLLLLVVSGLLLRKNLFLGLSITILYINSLLTVFYFPAILNYQPQNDFGRYIKEHIRSDNNFICYHFTLDFSTAFYAQHLPYKMFYNAGDLKQTLEEKKELIIITTDYGLQQMNENKIPYTLIEERKRFMVTKPNLSFLNRYLRNGISENVFLAEIKK